MAPFIHAKLFFAPLGYVQLTSLGSATGIDAPVNTTIMEVTVEGAGIRYRDDGVAPTASVGMPVAAGNSFQYAGDTTAIQFIAQSAGAILNISYYM